MVGLLLLITVTVLYAGYNLFIKASGAHVPEVATTTIAATICLQLVALATSLVFASVLLVRGGHVMQLSLATYGWAVAAGLCIGVAEIAYFYLFGGIGTGKPMAANVAIPAIVCGTTIITMAAGYFFFKETLSPVQMIGGACVVFGIVLLYLGRG